MSDLQVTATASYRLLPLVILNAEKPVPRELAEKFQKCFSPGVIRVDPRTKAVSVDKKKMRKETMSREVYRHPEFEGSVQLARVRDHFLCTYLILVVRVLTDILDQLTLNPRDFILRNVYYQKQLPSCEPRLLPSSVPRKRY